MTRSSVIDHSAKLNPTRTQGYAFAPDGKTFRTAALEYDLNPLLNTLWVKKLTVMEVDAATGKPLQSLLSLSATSATAFTFALSADGKRLAAMGGKDSEDAVTVYDVDRMVKLVSYRLPETKFPERFMFTNETVQALRNAKVPATVIEKLQVADLAYSEDEFKKTLAKSLTANELKEFQETILKQTRLTPPQKESGLYSWIARPTLVFSADGKRLLVYTMGFGSVARIRRDGDKWTWVSGLMGKIVVLNAATGKPLPSLEGAEFFFWTQPWENDLSRDGRLLALSGVIHTLDKEPKTDSDHAFSTRVWDTETGKVIKTWDHGAHVAFSPLRPMLAVLESNSDRTRLGFWDFTAEAAEKK